MAAVLDRHGWMAHLAHRVGLGFVETGTVMPASEPGDNRGIGCLLRNRDRTGWLDVHCRVGRARLGISIVCNSSTAAPAAGHDLVECMQRRQRFAVYLSLNLRALLRDLPNDDALMRSLLDNVRSGEPSQDEHSRQARRRATDYKKRLTRGGMPFGPCRTQVRRRCSLAARLGKS